MPDEKESKAQFVSKLIVECFKVNDIDDVSAIAGLCCTLMVIFCSRSAPKEEFETTLDILRDNYERVSDIFLSLKNMDKENS
jgi:hypothetical protein